MDTFTMSLISEYLNIQSSVMLSFSKMSCTQKIKAIKNKRVNVVNAHVKEFLNL